MWEALVAPWGIGGWVMLLGAGLISLVKGADVFVAQAKRLGIAWGLSPFAVGVLIVGVGTSLPELATGLAAAVQGKGQIAIANAVGSNITNILLIVGLIGTLAGLLRLGGRSLHHELAIFVVATVHFVAVTYDGIVDRWEGMLLAGTYLAYLAYQLFDPQAKEEEELVEEVGQAALSSTRTVGTFDVISSALLGLVGIGLVIGGAHLTVAAVSGLGEALGIAATAITLTVVALGTSLPELAVSLSAWWKGDTLVAMGNIFGSNAFNLLAGIGIPALFVPLTTSLDSQMLFSFTILIGASFILFVSGLARTVNRWEGVMLLLFYLFFLIKTFSAP